MLKFDDITDPQKIEQWLRQLVDWAYMNLFVPSTVVQVAVVAVAFLLAWLGAKRLQRLLDHQWSAPWYTRFAAPVAHALAPLSLPIIWLVLQWFTIFAARNAGWPNHLIEIVFSLLMAWIVIRLAGSLIRDRQWSRAISIAAWVIAALNITNLLEPTQAVLNDMGMNVGETYISVLSVIKAGIALAFLFWIAAFLSGLFERRLQTMVGMTPSTQVLFGKLFRIAVFVVAIVVGLESVGIDLTALAVFSGAIGLGIGFGLQKVISNLISGIILLMDKSVKPGDVISLGTTYGEIKTLGARYVSVITRDGTEHLIPNEDLISQRVENWSFSSRMIRVKMPFGISYESDVHKAMALALEVADEIDRVQRDPKPVCQLKGFGDSSLDLELRIWVDDPQNGLGNVCSLVLLGIWDKFRANGIHFPYPQRDIHIKSAPQGYSVDAVEPVVSIDAPSSAIAND